MKLFLPFLLILFLTAGTRKAGYSDQLCRENEEVVYSFPLQNGKKTVCICKEKVGKYLVYRFGTKTNLELEFPEYLDESSWKRFSLFADIFPTATPGTEGQFFKLSFGHDLYQYDIYEYRNGMTREVKIKVRSKGKVTVLPGNVARAVGSLRQLIDFKNKYHYQFYHYDISEPKELFENRRLEPEIVKGRKWKKVTVYETDFPNGKEKWDKTVYYQFSPAGKITAEVETEDENEDIFDKGGRPPSQITTYDNYGRLKEIKQFVKETDSDTIFVSSQIYEYNSKGQLAAIKDKDDVGEVTLSATMRYDARGNNIEYINHFSKTKAVRKFDNFNRMILQKNYVNGNELSEIDSIVYSKENDRQIHERYMTDIHKGKPIQSQCSIFTYDKFGRMANSVTHQGKNGELVSVSRLLFDNQGAVVQKYSMTQNGPGYTTKYTYNANKDLVKAITYFLGKLQTGYKWDYLYY